MHAWHDGDVEADIAALCEVDVAIFGWLIHDSCSNAVVIHIAPMAPHGHAIGYHHIILDSDPLGIAKINPHPVTDMHILPHLAAQAPPNGRAQLFLIEEFENIGLVGVVEDKTPSQGSHPELYQREWIDSPMFLLVFNQMEFV